MFRKILLLAICLSCAPAAAVHGIAAPGIDSGGLSLGLDVEVLEDPTGQMRLEDVLRPDTARRFASNDTPTANFGYTSSAYWLRFELQSDPGYSGPLLLELRFPSIDAVEFYRPVRGAQESLGPALTLAGDTRDWQEREFKHRMHVFRLDAPRSGVETYHLRVASEGVLTVPLFLWRESAFIETDTQMQFVFGAFYGLIAAMFLYNLLLYFVLRDPLYLLYVLYVGAFGMFLFVFDGYAFQYLWPRSVWWANHSIATALALALAFGTLFARAFLGMRRNSPLAATLMLATAGASFALAACGATGLLIGYRTTLQLLSALAPVTVAITLFVSVQEMLRGYRPARYFLLAWSALLAFVALGALRNFTLVPTNFLTIYGLHIGLVLDVLLLSFALGARINLMKRDTELAQAEALANQRALLEANRRHESELEQRIVNRTKELNWANERLHQEALERDALLAQLRENEERMRFMAQHDPLTGLPNRLSMHERFQLALELAKRSRKTLAVMMVDLNGFKAVNDTRGHAAGDAVLVAVTARLRTSVRGSDTVARYGGDEFVVLASDIERRDDAALIAEKIADMIGLSFPLPGGPASISASIGIALYPEDGQSTEALLAAADQAMYKAKSGAAERYVFHAAL